MLVKTDDYVLAANDHRHAARTRDSGHFIQSVAVFADIKLNVLDSLSRKELLRLATVVSSREAVNLDLVHSRFLLGVHVAGVPSSIRRSIFTSTYLTARCQINFSGGTVKSHSNHLEALSLTVLPDFSKRDSFPARAGALGTRVVTFLCGSHSRREVPR